MNNRKLTIGIGLIAFAFGARIGIRYTYLGPLANTFTQSAFLISILLSLGPFLGIFLSPIIGKRSDKTWTRFGRRLPYIMVSIPLVALFTILIPHSPNYTILIVLVICESIASIIGFSPLFALIPDNFIAEKRGKMNSIFVLFIGLGATCAVAIGYKLWAINYCLIFYSVAAITLVSGAVSFFFIKENPFPDNIISNKGNSLLACFKSILADKRITLYYTGDFFRWFCKSLVIQMVTLFAANELGIEIGLAGQVLLIFNMTKLLSALPIGVLTDKINRKLFLLAGTAVMAGAMGYGWYVHSYVTLLIVMGLFGISTTITIISGSALLMDLFPKGRAGEFMGLNTVFGSIPAVLSLWISGALIDKIGSYRIIFIIGMAASIIALIVTALIPNKNRLENS